jgi:hypothetical protein
MLEIEFATASLSAAPSVQASLAALVALMAAAIIPPMCGRYASFLPAKDLVRIFGTVNSTPQVESCDEQGNPG